MDNRRQHARVRGFFGGSLTVTAQPRPGATFDVAAVDLSRGGARLLVPRAAYELAAAALAPEGPGLPARLQLPRVLAGGRRCRIRRCAEPEQVTGFLGYTLGVQFSQPLGENHEPLFDGDHGPSAPRRRLVEQLSTDADTLLEELSRAWGYPALVSMPLENIVRRMEVAGASRVVLQHDYRDELHHEEFIALYNELFQPAPLCKRLLFFRASPSAGGREELLGAVVLRPFALGVRDRALGQVGRSMLAPLTSPGDDLEHYSLQARYRVFAANTVAEIVGVPYLQQDTYGSRCGHVALYVMSSFLHRQLDLAEVSPTRIRSLVGFGERSPYPMRGLTLQDAMKVVAEMGANPLAYYLPRRDVGVPDFDHGTKLARWRDFVELLHIYVDSHLPVMLTLSRPRRRSGDVLPGLHAVCVVGHTLQGAPLDPPEWRPLPHFDTTTRYVQDFIVHDDALGPYLRLPVRAGHEVPSDRSAGLGARPIDAIWGESVQGAATGMVVPLPPEVRLTAEHVIAKTGTLLRRLPPFYEQQLGDGGVRSAEAVALLGAIAEETVLCSIYLDLSNRVSANVASSALAGEAEDGLLENVLLPKYVWVVELSARPCFEPRREGSRMLGFIIFDATASQLSPEPFLVIKLPGLFIETDPRVVDGWFTFPCSSKPFRQFNLRNFLGSGSTQRGLH